MMRERRRGHNVKTMWALILVAIAYIGWLYYQRTLTGNNKLDGSLGWNVIFIGTTRFVSPTP
jgi:hypothetical protein